MKKTALTLGKYAPLHKGHQLVLETALRECDEVVCMIYDSPTVTDVPLPVRAGWIRKLYPQAHVIECWDGPDGYGSDPRIVREQNDYILQKLAGRKITHFYSSEFYGESVGAALGAIDRRVDEARRQVPVSATMIRENPYRFIEYMHPLVYADLIARVVFVGAMSTGKTTLAKTLAQRFDTRWMPEYGREYWEKHQVDRRIGFEAFNEIATGHIEREDALARQANRYLFVDTNAVTTHVFALDYHGRAPTLLADLACRAQTRYDLWFLCDDDIPYDNTWDRSGPQKREWFHRMVVADLNERRIPYLRLRGDLAARIATVERVLARFRKYRSVAEAFQEHTRNG